MTGATRVHVHGAFGRMGSTAAAAIRAAPDMVVAGQTGRGDDLAAALAAGRPEVMVDFTVAAAAPAGFRAAAAAGCHVVSGTTGIAPAELAAIGAEFAARRLGLLAAPNFALGVILLQRFAREAVRYFADVEIVELHHERKLDAPSGTALATARQLAAAAGGPLNSNRAPATEAVAGCRGGSVAGVPVHAIRLPGLLAHQEVLFGGPGEVLRLRHDATDRAAFMPGVLLAIRGIGGRVGLIDSLDAMLPAVRSP